MEQATSCGRVPDRVTIRIAKYRKAIENARMAGFSWREIAALFSASPDAVRKAMGTTLGREEEQLPLPASPLPAARPAMPRRPRQQQAQQVNDRPEKPSVTNLQRGQEPEMFGENFQVVEVVNRRK